MADIEFPDDLIERERAAWEQIPAGAPTVNTAFAVQQAVSAFAAEVGEPRIDVEMALKRIVRHPEPEAA
ncbi:MULTISPECIES: hypothetical protein [unclassified Streptomyces]|uniref:CopG family transcriptional regulator n=1 Tax=Streptomyces sp. NBC_00119 TaxID=2975659 RepID=A0AAU1U151_9ACTN|nr:MULTISPECIES: hypothetical protein [unclassified Streptomyces]MCX4641407.1 hypothetical protein [Streptomyces sp. NBC_01446]MCX5322172.1 hypothetical protein [Streptomyces sp. NBC_00120]